MPTRLEAADRADLARHVAGRRLTVGAMGEVDRAALRLLSAEPFDPARVHGRADVLHMWVPRADARQRHRLRSR
jgi:hypothetical protein